MTLLDNSTNEDTFDETKEYYSELVGADRPFKTNEDLAKGKARSDTYIKLLEKRLDDARDMYLKEKEDRTSTAKLDELIKRLDQGLTPQQLASNEQPVVNEVKEKPIKLEDIEARFEAKIREYESTKKQEENYNIVKAKLAEQLGKNYADTVRDRIKEIGLSEQDLENLARKSPTAVFNALGLTQTKSESFQTPPKSVVNFKPQGAQKRTLSYYHELKKTNPKLYLDRTIAIQMDKDANELGEAFFDV